MQFKAVEKQEETKQPWEIRREKIFKMFDELLLSTLDSAEIIDTDHSFKSLSSMRQNLKDQSSRYTRQLYASNGCGRKYDYKSNIFEFHVANKTKLICYIKRPDFAALKAECEAEDKEKEEKKARLKRGEYSPEDTIDTLKFSGRTYNCLRRAGITTISEVASLTNEELLKIRNIGRKSTKEIITKLDDLHIDHNMHLPIYGVFDEKDASHYHWINLSVKTPAVGERVLLTNDTDVWIGQLVSKNGIGNLEFKIDGDKTGYYGSGETLPVKTDGVQITKWMKMPEL